MNLKEIQISELSFNPFDRIGKDWYLITSGNQDSYNTMTASWGTMGFFWGKPVVNCYIRPQRYTYEFIEKNDLFTISFFDESQRAALQYCGSHSGREVDKAKATGLTPVFLEGTTAFQEANLIFVCKKLYRYKIKPEEMLTEELKKWYPNQDYHHCYYAEIVKAYRAAP